MKTRRICLPTCACIAWVLLGALASNTAVGDDPSLFPSDRGQQPTPTLPSPEEQRELERFIRQVEAERSAIDEMFGSSKDKDALLDALALIFERKEYNQSKYAYSKLIDFFEGENLSPMFRAYERTKGVEARIWFAAAADYCGNTDLLERLGNEVRTQLKGESQVRAAIAVAFKLGDASMVPYLIEALPSKTDFWVDFREKAGPSAAYLLTELTNQFFDEHPVGLMNFSCWIMPPPVVPYPIPHSSERCLDTCAQVQPQWREWWEANKSKSQKEWILEGIQRDVLLFRSASLASDPQKLDKGLVRRLQRFLGVDVEFAAQPMQELEAAWTSAQREYTIPPRMTK